MAKQTKGKRTASKAALKKAPARGASLPQAKRDQRFRAGRSNSKREVEHVVPRMTRS